MNAFKNVLDIVIDVNINRKVFFKYDLWHKELATVVHWKEIEYFFLTEWTNIVYRRVYKFAVKYISSFVKYDTL